MTQKDVTQETADAVYQSLRSLALKALSIKQKSPVVPVPEQFRPEGVELYLRVLNTQQYTELLDKLNEVGQGKIFSAQALAHTAIACVVDAENNPIFTEKDYTFLLEEASGGRLFDLCRLAYVVNGVYHSDELKKLLTKN